ncbi:MAG: GGDEF domain-containing protein [Baekduia sp.]
MLNGALERVFGGPEVHRQAFDMMRRLERAYPAAWTVISLSFVPGLVYYTAWPIVPLSFSGLFYYLALTWPARSRLPELTAAATWGCGLISSLIAARVAGPPYAYLWVGAAISVPFIGMIWPPRVVLVSVATLATAIVAGAVLWVPERIGEEPPALVGPLVGLVMLTVMISMVYVVDRRNRLAVLTDVLTGLGNRAAMDTYVRELLRDGGKGSPIALVAFDLDHFKALNDDLGHATGDDALRATAEALASAAPDGAGVFRYGGEEFVVLLPEVEQREAERIADRLRTAVAGVRVGDRSLTVSGGLVLDRLTEELDLGSMFHRADAALYDAKAQGRNRVLVGLPQLPGQRHRHGLRLAAETVARPRPGRGSWRLVRTRLERDHLRVMWNELRNPENTRQMNLGLVLLAAAGAFWLGPGPLIVALIAFLVLDPAVRRRSGLPVGLRGGELGLLWESLFGMVMLSIAIISANQEALYLLPLIAIPAFPSIVAYRSLGSILIGVTGALLMLVTGLIVDPGLVVENPLVVSLPVGLIGVTTLIGMALVSSTMEHAAAANIDPLTGALNRGALEARVAELQRADSGSYGPVTLIVADLDHFKQINDTYGHDTGDQVLVDVARRMQEELRLVDVLYRIGGEEFVVLLPQTGRPEAAQIAERLREAISERPCGGRALTVSLGLSSSLEHGFEYAPAFDRADAALLAAKEEGRNRVVIADEPGQDKNEASSRETATGSS